MHYGLIQIDIQAESSLNLSQVIDKFLNILEKQTIFKFVLKTNIQQHKLCEAATQLFFEKGYENVSLKEIAEAAEIAENEAYKHFGSKEDVIFSSCLHFSRF